MELTKEEKEEYEKILQNDQLPEVFNKFSKDGEMSNNQFL